MTDAVDLGIEGITDAVEIGRGGFATVYRARQDAFDRDVAVKVLDIRPNEEKLQRFSREARAMGALGEHRGILPLFDAGTTAGGSPYLLMPFMSGGSLRDMLDRGDRLGWQAAFTMGEELADALAAAHDEGIIHRDLKPGNVLLGRYGDPVLADFGIARIAGGPETTAGTVTASLAHAAPEVLDGQGPSVASDIYGLASTIYALITGHGPHEVEGDESVLPLITRTLSNPVPRIDGVPAPVQSVLAAAMSKDPDERPNSAAAFAGSLRAARQTSAAPPPEGSSTPAPPERSAPHTVVVDTTPSPVAPSPAPRKPIGPIAGGIAAIVLVITGLVLFSTNDEGESGLAEGAVPTDQATDASDNSASTPTDTGVPTPAAPTPVPATSAPGTPAAPDGTPPAPPTMVTAVTLAPVDNRTSPRDQEQLNGLVEQSVITAWMDAPTVDGLISTSTTRLDLAPGEVQTTTIPVQQGEVLFATTADDQIDSALGVLGANRLFLRSDDASGLEGNPLLALPLARGGDVVFGVANVGSNAGATTVIVSTVGTTPVNGPGRFVVAQASDAAVAGFRLSVGDGGQGGPGPGPIVTTTPLDTLTITTEGDAVVVWLVDERGRVRAQGQGDQVEVNITQLEPGVFTVLAMATPGEDVILTGR